MTMETDNSPQRIDRLLRRKEVESITGLARSTLYEVMKTGAFPAPVKLSARTVAWRESEVAEWVRSRPKITYG